MMRENTSKVNIGVITVIPPVISPKFISTPNFPVLNCASCQISCAIKYNPSVIKKSDVPQEESILSWNKYGVGVFPEDNVFVKNTGHLTSVYGCEGFHLHFHGRTIFQYSETGIIWI